MPGELDCSKKVDSHDTLVDTQLGFNSSPPANKSAKYQMSTNKIFKDECLFFGRSSRSRSRDGAQNMEQNWDLG